MKISKEKKNQPVEFESLSCGETFRHKSGFNTSFDVLMRVSNCPSDNSCRYVNLSNGNIFTTKKDLLVIRLDCELIEYS